jgi:hypothetical protein
MLQREKTNWKSTCWCVMLKSVSLLMRTTVIGKTYLKVQYQLFKHIKHGGIHFFRNLIGFLFDHSKYFPEHKLPENVIATTDAKAALIDADYCVHAVPVQVFGSHSSVLVLLFSNWYLFSLKS